LVVIEVIILISKAREAEREKVPIKIVKPTIAKVPSTETAVTEVRAISPAKSVTAASPSPFRLLGSLF
jgi:hypothetical protein